MKSQLRLVVLFLVLPVLLRLPAAATTYLRMPDAALADQAAVVADVTVAAVSGAPTVGEPATDYLVEIQRVLKGSPSGSTVVVRVPGGVDPAGLGLKIYGAPRFGVGERALLFLRPAADGTYRILQLMLGAFHQRTVGGRSVALRDLSEAHDAGAKSQAEDGAEPVRDYGRFADWVADRAAGARGEGGYEVAGSKARLNSLAGKYVFLGSTDGNPIRWFRFDNGQSAQWRAHAGGQPGLGQDATVSALQDALAAWSTNPGTDVRYVYGGTTTAEGGLSHSDGVNTVLFDDPAQIVEGTFDCGSGGVIAMGGPFYYTQTRSWKGKPYHEAIEGDIVTNDGTACFFQNDPSVAREIFAHELGHSLGLGHSLDHGALMYAYAHDDGRGAALSDDDRAGIAALYGDGSPVGGGGGSGSGGGGSLAAPVRVRIRAISSTAVALTWRDKAQGEESYEIEMKPNNPRAAYQVVATLPAGATAAQVTGLRPKTLYLFRVRAVAGDRTSPYSAVVRIRTPR